MANVYDIGDGIRLTAAFSIDGSGANPDTVTVTVMDPSGNKTTPAAGSGTDGAYNVDSTIVDEQGTWYYHFAGTGAVVAAGEGHFFVRKKETA